MGQKTKQKEHIMGSMIDKYIGEEIDLEEVTCLYENGEHKIYWLGIDNETAFRCNAYLIKSQNEAIIVDPGSREFFEVVKRRVLQVAKLEDIVGIIACHQDPDVCASMVDWLELKPDITIMTTDRTNVLLPHYGNSEYEFYSVNQNPNYTFKSGFTINFIEAPFLHFAGAFTTYDVDSGFLFSGDIWAALDIEWNLVVDDFEKHLANMNLFNIDYMASNIAARGFVKKLENVNIESILPQHGSIINKTYVKDALEYLRTLKCGTDIIYGDIDL